LCCGAGFARWTGAGDRTGAAAACEGVSGSIAGSGGAGVVTAGATAGDAGVSGAAATGRIDGPSSGLRMSAERAAKRSSASAPTMTATTILRMRRCRSTSAGLGTLADTSLNDADDRLAGGGAWTPGFELTPPTNGIATYV
jgi:hypothetical protein